MTHYPEPFWEAELFDGLKPLVQQELRRLGGGDLHFLTTANAQNLPFRWAGDPAVLCQSRLASAIYLGQTYPITRPKALLGHQHFHTLLAQISRVRQAGMHTFCLRAAGADSAVFRRLKAEIAQHTALELSEPTADLLLRVRRAPAGWDVLCRLTPRPLTTRSWRVADWPGALNGPLAAALVMLSQPQPTDRYLNLMCGSGTLLVERAALGTAAQLVGLDHSRVALEAAQRNLAAAQCPATLIQGDAQRLPWPRDSFEVVAADLPWGHLVGSAAQNERLYPAFLREAARVLRPDGRLVLITHDRVRLERFVRQAKIWQVVELVKLRIGQLRPRLYVLEKRDPLEQ